MTDPAGTVSLDSLDTVPTVRPACVMRDVAPASVWLTTSGTVNASRIEVVATVYGDVPSVQIKPIWFAPTMGEPERKLRTRGLVAVPGTVAHALQAARRTSSPGSSWRCRC